MLSVKKTKEISRRVRENIIMMLYAAGSGHSAGSLGAADIITTLYFNVMNHNPKNPEWRERDYFILSNGHICPALYATLAEAGYFKKELLGELRKIGSPLQGHPHKGSLPGIENSSGPLGQGLSYASGLALGLKRLKRKNRVFCLSSDGEHQEGQAWESAMFAAKNELSNLVVIIDRNHIQISGTTNDVMPLRSVQKKYEAFNWETIRVNGHDIAALRKALRKKHKAPLVVIADTIPGKGVSFMENDHKWHGKAPNENEAIRALNELRGFVND